MKHITTCITLSFMLISLPACAATEKSGTLHGTIVSRDASSNTLTVAHGEVKGIMGAMTMAYPVRGQSVASLPKDGVRISATLHESNGTYWLTGVQPIEQRAAPKQAMSEMPAGPLTFDSMQV